MKYLLLAFIIACSSQFKKDYEVIDASNEDRPEWINDLYEWAEDEDDDYYKDHRYFVYTSEPKLNREIACKTAAARARSAYAAEISTSIKDSFKDTMQGEPDKKLKRYVENQLTSDVEAVFQDARQYRTYWEKRSYQKELGADSDKKSFVCSVLIRVAKEHQKKAYSIALKKMQEQANSTASKQAVEQIIEKAQK